MARKNVLHPYPIINAGDLSGNLTSVVTDIKFLDNIALQFHATGTPTGTMYVEGSNDYKPGDITGSPAAAGNWVAVPGVTPPTFTGSPVDALLNMTMLAFAYIRVRYVAGAGAGALTVTISGKSLGA